MNKKRPQYIELSEDYLYAVANCLENIVTAIKQKHSVNLLDNLGFIIDMTHAEIEEYRSLNE